MILSIMKLIALLLIYSLHTNIIFAQQANKDTTACKCNKTFNVNYPDVAEEDELEGTVMVEFEIDSTCIQSNPIIIQSLGDLFDKEALRVVKIMIAFNNNCVLKCRFTSCKKTKKKFPLTFKKSD